MDVTEGGHFAVRGATGFSICYVYAREDKTLRGSYMTNAEVVVIAQAIANLPEPQTWIPR